MDEKLLNVDDLAQYLNVSKRTVHRLLKSSELPTYKIGGQLRFSQEEVADWLKRHKVKNTA